LETVDKQLTFADEHVEKGDFAAAADIYENIIQQDSANEVAHINLSYVYLKLGRYSDGENLLVSWLIHAQLPIAADIFINLAAAQTYLLKFNEALYNFDKAEEINPHRAELYLELGRLYAQMGDHQSELDTLEKGIECCRESPELYNYIGSLLNDHFGDHARAIVQFSKGLSLAPDDPTLRNNFGIALVATGDSHAAASHLEHAIKLDEDYTSPYRNLAVAYFNMERYDDAAKILTIAIEKFPEHPERSNMEAMLRDLE
jgi:tetratricopeptide (TPR) repeat protein